MDNFLNGFTNKSYEKKQNKEAQSIKKAQEKVENSTQESKKKLEKNKQNNRVIPETNSSKKEQNEIEKPKRTGAFAEEEIKIDPDFHKYKFARVAAICGTIIIIFSISVWLYLFVNATSVESFVGEKIDYAEDKMNKSAIKYDIEYIDKKDVPKGEIVEQLIPAGDKIGIGQMQVFKVSNGPDLEEPIKFEFTKKTNEKDIENFINDKLLDKVKIVKEYDNDIEKGQFIRVDFPEEFINAENYRRKNDALIIVSAGKKSENKKAVVPDFSTQLLSKAEDFATENGLILKVKRETHNYPEGYIVSQSVAKGKKLGFSDKLEVVVSKGPGEPMPQVYGYTLEKAEKIAEENEITLNPKEMYSDTVAKGVIISQEKVVGSAIYEGDTVDVVVSKGRLFLQDFTGMNIYEVQTTIDDLNKEGANLKYQIKYVKDEDETKGTVSKVSRSSELVALGTTIVLTVTTK